MKNKLNISVADESPKDRIVMCQKTMNKGLFKKLFWFNPDKLTIIIPGDSVQDATIQKVVEEGGSKNK